MILTSIGTLSYGLSQTSTDIYYMATEAQAASNDIPTHLQPINIKLVAEQSAPPQRVTKTVLTPSRQISTNTLNLSASSSQIAKKVGLETSTKKTDASTAIKSQSISVPFISQLTDIIDPAWKKIGCGIASLAMIINFYEPELVEVNDLLEEGIDAGAYTKAGWAYAGLISVAKKHGMIGQAYDLGEQAIETAFSSFGQAVIKRPVIASVHYKFEATNPIPHLVVVTEIKDNLVYYNDPASKKGGLSISLATFKTAWKKRYLEFAPIS